jgi:SRSO17 transposase
LGLLSEGERKSIEPIAARCVPDPHHVDAAHQRLQHFVTDSQWNDRAVRRYAARHAVSAMTRDEPIVSWIVDDTGFLKQGTHSVGVQRQYTGSAGKVANCQVGTSLVVTTRTMHLGIDFELYLPKSWTDDPERRREARIPADVPFKTKPQQALAMIQRAVEDGLPTAPILADCGFGDSKEFRDGLRALGLHYAVGVEAKTRARWVDGLDDPLGDRHSLLSIAQQLRVYRRYRRVTWREGTKASLRSRFAFERVMPSPTGRGRRETEAVWLVVEWPDGKPAPSGYYFVSCPDLTPKQMVRLIKERYRTEAVYSELKGELGLDHFEGRRFPGWHHHVSVVLCCHAFLVAERSFRFPPSARRTTQNDPISLAA